MKRRRGRAWVRWTLLGATAVVAGLDLVGVWWGVVVTVPPLRTVIWVSGGCVSVSHVSRFAVAWAANATWHESSWSPWCWDSSNSSRFVSANSGWWVTFPTWALLAPLVATTVWLFSRGRAVPPVGVCPVCRYSRVGLPSHAPCPECNAAAPNRMGTKG
jgi:hypothetical protein